MQERPGRSVRAGFDRHFDQRRPGLRERFFQREFQLGGRFREISGRTAATNASALKQLRAEGSAEVLQLEVSERKAVAQAAKDILGRHGRIDILINIASLPPRVCVEAIVISPTWNRFYLGGLEKAKA